MCVLLIFVRLFGFDRRLFHLAICLNEHENWFFNAFFFQNFSNI